MDMDMAKGTIPDESEDEEMKRAIALSLQEEEKKNNLISKEDLELARAVESSMADFGPQSKKICIRDDSATEVITVPEDVEEVNPHVKRRKWNYPAGLENVGNSCWFSCMAQSLFHIRPLRDLILQFQPSPELLSQATAKEQQILRFVVELRILFAFMWKSKKALVDPRSVVAILEAAIGQSSAQQDVSELTHLFLQWLEEAFKLQAKEDKTGSNLVSSNPITDLFYGNLVHKAVNYDGGNDSKEVFSKFQIHFTGHEDLHSALAASMVQEVEMEQTTFPKPYRQQYFTRLPPVLTFDLCRFRFNTQMNKTEKINGKLAFPSRLYMARYMNECAEETRTTLAKVTELQQQLAFQRHQLRKWKEYGRGRIKAPLPYILQCAAYYTRSKLHVSSDLNCEHNGTDNMETSLDVEMESPRELNAESARIIAESLEQWSQMEQKALKNAQQEIANLERAIEHMFDTPLFNQIEYRLHAVLVHDGSATSGHYWAYVRDYHNPESWFKMDDTKIERTSEEAMRNVAFGGDNRNSSAYCLIYLAEPNNCFKLDWPAMTSELPEDLKAKVLSDNLSFAQEIKIWNQQDKVKSVDDLMQSLKDETKLSFQHAARAKNDTVFALSCVEEEVNNVDQDLESIAFKVLAQQILRMHEKSKHEFFSHALQNMAVYLLGNEVEVEPYIHWLLLQQFTYVGVLANPVGSALWSTFLHMLDHHQRCCESKPGMVSETKVFEEFHETYSLYCLAAIQLVEGFNRFKNGLSSEGLKYFVAGMAKNGDIMKSRPSWPKAAFPTELLERHRLHMIKTVNQETWALYKQAVIGQKVNYGLLDEILDILDLSLLPALSLSQCSDAEFSAESASLSSSISTKWYDVLTTLSEKVPVEENLERVVKILETFVDSNLEDNAPETNLDLLPKVKTLITCSSFDHKPLINMYSELENAYKSG